MELLSPLVSLIKLKDTKSIDIQPAIVLKTQRIGEKRLSRVTPITSSLCLLSPLPFGNSQRLILKIFSL
jgi:hypothetical protein